MYKINHYNYIRLNMYVHIYIYTHTHTHKLLSLQHAYALYVLYVVDLVSLLETTRNCILVLKSCWPILPQRCAPLVALQYIP